MIIWKINMVRACSLLATQHALHWPSPATHRGENLRRESQHCILSPKRIPAHISQWSPVTDLPHWPALDFADQSSGERLWPYGEGSPARSRPPAAPSLQGWERREAPPKSPGRQRGNWVAVMGPRGRMNPGPGKNNSSASWSQYPWEMRAGNTILRKSRMINTLAGGGFKPDLKTMF